MKNKVPNSHDNQKGMVSLVFAGVLAVIISMVIGQIVLNQLNLYSVHSSTRTQIDVNLRLKALALRFKEALNQSQVSTGCPGSLERRTINGGEFCLPPGRSLCTNLTKVINGRQLIERACTSLRNADMRWDDATSGNENLTTDSPSSITTGVRNRIRVPATTNALWQSCQAPNVCLRILLCANGATSCRASNAIAYQVVRY